MKILITGGAGYIGSHVAVELSEAGYEPVIVDNFCNSQHDVIDRLADILGKSLVCHEGNCCDQDFMRKVFSQEKNVEGVIHFAASKAVGESVEKPLLYYENNINTLVYILQELQTLETSNFIFSSSCTVYGQADEMPITEDAPVKLAESPYGNTKQIGEEIIKDLCNVNNKFNGIALRYFNPIGAHETAKIGELPLGVPQNLIPYVVQTAAGIRECLSVFGDDYDTPDGTAIRDYIHVVDLAKAHIVALNRLLKNENKLKCEFFNIGTGKGSSVLEVVKAFEKATNKKVNYKIVARRTGDITAAFADTSFANKELGWKAELSLEVALASSWKWQESL